MASVTLRFYGRFVYAEAMKSAAPANKISAIAPNFDIKRFGKHQALMTIQRDQIEFGEEGSLTTLPPTFRHVTDHPAVLDAEMLVWDLSGFRVTYDLVGAVDLRETSRGAADANLPERKVLDLEHLEELRGGAKPQIAPGALRPDVRGRSSAVVEITAGRGVARPVLESPIELAKESDILAARAAITRAVLTGITEGPLTIPTIINAETKKPESAVPADLVEFVVTIPGRVLTLSFSNGSNELVGLVTVKENTTVAFSNLCCDLRAPQFQDLEFSQYYHLLKDEPHPDVLIPVEVGGRPQLGEGQDCDVQARLRYDLA